MFNRVTQQERKTEEEQQNPQLCQRVALHKPAHQGRHDSAKSGWLLSRRFRDRHRFRFRLRTPGVFRLRGNVDNGRLVRHRLGQHRCGCDCRGLWLRRIRRTALLKLVYPTA